MSQTVGQAAKYSMVIQWSDEDQAYIVSLPEWGPYVHTHGSTYQEAVPRGVEVLETAVEATQRSGRPLPTPSLYAADNEDEPTNAPGAASASA